jgi:hypothetical protein
MKIKFCIVILVLLSLNSFSNYGHIYQVDSQEFELTRIEYLLNQKVIPFSYEPVSTSQIMELLKKIPSVDKRLKNSLEETSKTKGLKMISNHNL